MIFFVPSLTAYLDNLKQNVAGQGKLMRLPNLMTGATPLSSLPPASLPTSFSADAISSIYNTVPKPFKAGAGEPANQEPEFPPPPPELLEDNEPPVGSFLKPPSAFLKKSRTPSPTLLHDPSHPTQPPSHQTSLTHNQNQTPNSHNLAEDTTHLYTDPTSNQGRIPSQDTALLGDNQHQQPSEEDENKNVKVGDFIRSLNKKQSEQNQQKPGVNGKSFGNINSGVSHNNEPNTRSVSPNAANGRPLVGAKFEPKPYIPTTNSLKIESFNQINEVRPVPNKMMAKNLDNGSRHGTDIHRHGTTPHGTEIHRHGTTAHPAQNQSVRVTDLDQLVEDLNRVNVHGDSAVQDVRNGNTVLGKYRPYFIMDFQRQAFIT